jgi:phosphonate transport system ATP-binding protein
MTASAPSSTWSASASTTFRGKSRAASVTPQARKFDHDTTARVSVDVRHMLRVENLTKVYDDGTVALRDVSFEVPDGQFLAIIGLSGSGKSSLLRCLNRLVEPTSGRIWWNDEEVTTATQEDLRLIRRRIGMVFQNFNLVHRSKVITNVLAGRLGYVNPALAIINRFPRADVAKAMAQLARVGLTEKAGARADELSGGQQQRVGIARAMMQDPQMVLADEPVASLDPVLAHSIMQYLELINDEDRVTVLCSLHFLDLVHRYADRAIALNRGELVFDGAPQEIDDDRFKDIYGQEAERVG